jgi:hypothetical protein
MMTRSWTDDALKAAVTNNTTISGALRTMGLSVSPGNFRTLHKYVAQLGIDTSHFKGQAHGTSFANKRPLEEILVAGSYVSSGNVKKRLFKEGLLRCECYECGGPPVWRGKPLTLQLDHINGDTYDNRLENLRLLCPNCHAQTRTFAGLNKKGLNRSRYKREPHACTKCGVVITARASDKCASCANPLKGTSKIEWPEVSSLLIAVDETSYAAVGRALGVADNTVKKYIKTKLGYAPRKRKTPRLAA